MSPSIKKLRPYQVRLVTDVCRATEDVLVEQPTASGKTLQIITLVAMHLGHRGTADKQRFLTAVNAEKNQTYATSASAVYCLGMTAKEHCSW